MEKKKVLLILNYQNDLVQDVSLDEKIGELVETYIKDNDSLIVCTKETHSDNDNVCVRGSKGWMLYGEVGKLVLDSNFNKKELQGEIQKICLGANLILGKPYGEVNNVSVLYTNKAPYEKICVVESPNLEVSKLNELFNLLKEKFEISDIQMIGTKENVSISKNLLDSLKLNITEVLI